MIVQYENGMTVVCFKALPKQFFEANRRHDSVSTLPDEGSAQGPPNVKEVQIN
jgi:hypothetical protein